MLPHNDGPPSSTLSRPAIFQEPPCFVTVIISPCPATPSMGIGTLGSPFANARFKLLTGCPCVTAITGPSAFSASFWRRGNPCVLNRLKYVLKLSPLKPLPEGGAL